MRTSLAKEIRDTSFELNRKKFISHLSRWDDFRVRKQEAINSYLILKQKQTRCDRLLKHVRLFHILKRVYRVFEIEKYFTEEEARR